MKLGELVLPWRRPATVESSTAKSPFKEIEDIAIRAGNIWFDRGDKKKECFQKAADSLLEHLTPAVVSNPDFYQQVDGKIHNLALDLLGTFVPKDENDLIEFMKGPVHRLTASYLREIIARRVMILFDKAITDDSLEEYKARVASHLRVHSNIPNHYLDLISPEVGLPLPPKRQSPDSPVKD